MSQTRDRAPVLIVGGGLSGLSCAEGLQRAGVPFDLFEGADGFGGRASSDRYDGFLLDRGFQVLLCAYPEAQRLFDYDALGLGYFYPGALVRCRGRFHRVADPWRRPVDAFKTLLGPVGTVADKLRLGLLRRRILSQPEGGSLGRPISTLQALEGRGFSKQIIEKFFRPFFGGVFLDPSLATSSELLEFVFGMFARGAIALPEGGMGSLASQLVHRLPESQLHSGSKVVGVDSTHVKLADGEQRTGRAVVVATDWNGAGHLTGLAIPGSRRALCLYFRANKAPIEEPVLVLNGEGSGPVNNLCVPSNVVAGYAPAGEALVSVTVLEWQGSPIDVKDAVQDQLAGWFGADVSRWDHLRTYQIEHALPSQLPPLPTVSDAAKPLSSGVFVCGDYRINGSINGALLSGRLVAEALVEEEERIAESA